MYRTDDELEDTYRQHSLDILRGNIEIMLSHTAGEDEFVTIDLDEIDIDGVDEYIDKMEIDQDLDFKLLRVRKSRVGGEELFKTLCDYTGIPSQPFNPEIKHRVYFIEIANYMITVIPIQTYDGFVRVRIEPFNLDSPEFLKKMYKKTDKMKNLKEIKKEFNIINLSSLKK